CALRRLRNELCGKKHRLMSGRMAHVRHHRDPVVDSRLLLHSLSERRRPRRDSGPELVTGDTAPIVKQTQTKVAIRHKRQMVQEAPGVEIEVDQVKADEWAKALLRCPPHNRIALEFKEPH